MRTAQNELGSSPGAARSSPGTARSSSQQQLGTRIPRSSLGPGRNQERLRSNHFMMSSQGPEAAGSSLVREQPGTSAHSLAQSQSLIMIYGSAQVPGA